MSNPGNVDPTLDSQASDVKNHQQNAADEANTGLPASSSNFPNLNTAGDSTTNTSQSIKGAGSGVSGQGVDLSGSALKTPRKTDGPAHSAPGGTLHGDPERHGDK